MPINIPVDERALTDPRFGHLARLLGFADADHARSKVEWLWYDCTLRGETELPQWVVEHRLGPAGPEALIECQLASWAGGRGDSKTRRMYIHGSEKRSLWYQGKDGSKTEQRAKGGKSRASQASRNPAGQFQLAGESAGDTPPADAGSAGPAASSSLDLSLSLIPEEDSLPRAIPPVPTPEPNTTAVPSSDSVHGTPKPKVRETEHPNIRVNLDAWAYAASEHAKLIPEIDPTAIRWPTWPGGAAKDDLVERTRELVGNPPNYSNAIEVHRRRVDVAVAEARRAGHLRWFVPAVFYEQARFDRAAQTSPEQAAASSRAGPRVNGARTDEPIRKIKTL